VRSRKHSAFLRISGTNTSNSAKVFHIPLIRALPDVYKIHGIVQRSPKPDDNAEKDYPGTKAYRSIDEALQDADVDVVVITSIPETHFDMCKSALQAGKHVVVEKPFVPTAAEADELCEIAKKSGKKFAVYQNRRWDADFVTLKQVIASGSLGDIAEFETHFDRHRPDPPADSWKVKDAPGNGAIYDLGTHLIDQVYSLFGNPERVTGFVGVQRRSVAEGGSHDSCTVLLHYDGGKLLVTAKAGVVSPEVDQLRFWVRGTKGGFRKCHLDPQEDQLKGAKAGAALPENFGVEADGRAATVTTLGEGGKLDRKVWDTVSPPPTYVEYYRLFGKAIAGEGEVPVKAEEARDVLEIVEAVLQSSKEGKTITL
jgi:predicted dehydrogenase